MNHFRFLTMIRTPIQLALLTAFLWSVAPVLQAGGAPAERWSVHLGEDVCILARTQSVSGSTRFAIRMPPGATEARLLFPASLSRSRDFVPLKLRVDPAGEEFDVIAIEGRIGSETMVSIENAPHGFLQAFRSARTIIVNERRGEIFRIALPDPSSALQPFDQCLAEGMRAWGIDPDSRARLRRLPQKEGSDWAGKVIPPPSAFRRSGVFYAFSRLTVSDNGRVTACATVRSSGLSGLDAAICAAARAHGRYAPALDASGLTVAADLVETTRFEIA